jgi:hypothetical protein
MWANSIARKTARGRRTLQSQTFTGTIDQQVFLSVIDGRKTLRELANTAGQLFIDETAVLALLDEGLIEWVPQSLALKRARTRHSSPLTRDCRAAAG